MKKLIATALLVAPVSAMAQGEPLAAPRTFQRDGVTFTYTVAQKDGATEIVGADSNGRPFRFLVKEKRVTGAYANKEVDFRRPAARSALSQSAD